MTLYVAEVLQTTEGIEPETGVWPAGTLNATLFSPDFLEGASEIALSQHLQQRSQESKAVPAGYGIIYLNLPAKQIHSLQGFDFPGLESMFWLMGQFRGQGDHARLQSAILNGLVKITFKDEGTVPCYTLKEFFGDDRLSFLSNIATVRMGSDAKHAKSMLMNNYGKKILHTPFWEVIDRNPHELFLFPARLEDFSYHFYSETPEEAARMRVAIEQVTSFDEADISNWDAWLKSGIGKRRL